MATLLELANKHFDASSSVRKKLSEPEVHLINCVEVGNDWDRRSKKHNDNPSKAVEWGNNRVLNAEVIVWLCKDVKARKHITDRGIWIYGARIKGELNLNCAKFNRPLVINNSAIADGIECRDAYLYGLDLSGSHLGKLFAERLKVPGPIYLRNGFMAKEEVTLQGASIGDNLDCSRGLFLNKSEYALDASNMKVKGHVFLNEKFTASSQLRISDTTIFGNLECTDGQFLNPGGDAIDANGIKVGGYVFLNNNFKAKGEVQLMDASIGGTLNCDGGQFYNKGNTSLSAERIKVKGDVLLGKEENAKLKFHANGLVCLRGATIGGDIKCSFGEFNYKNNKALDADGVKVAGCIFLNKDFKASGEVQLRGANIGGNLDCKGGNFDCANGYALSANRCQIAGHVFLSENFKAFGKVRLRDTKIGGNLDCTMGNFRNENDYAFAASRAKVAGDVNLSRMQVDIGEVRLTGVNICGSLVCKDGHFNNPKGNAFYAPRMQVTGDVKLNGKFKAKGEVHLVGAQVGGKFICDGGNFEGGNGEEDNIPLCALAANGMDVRGDIYFRDGFTIKGAVRLQGTLIGGNLGCRKGRFLNSGCVAIGADRINVAGNVFLNKKFKSYGTVKLDGAIIGADWLCDEGTFENEDGDAISADGIKVTGNVHFRFGFKAKGEVGLRGANIGGNIDCEKGIFNKTKRYAFSASRVRVTGGIMLHNGFESIGEVRLRDANIGRDLMCTGGSFTNTDGGNDANIPKAINADGIKVAGDILLCGESDINENNKTSINGKVSLIQARVGKHFQWFDIENIENAALDLREAKVGTLWIGKKENEANKFKDMPWQNRCWLDGLTYDFIYDGWATDSNWWIQFIARQNLDIDNGGIKVFVPQPYEQAAKVLKEHGHVEAGREVLMAKELRRSETIRPFWNASEAWKNNCKRENKDNSITLHTYFKIFWVVFLLFLVLVTQRLWYYIFGKPFGFGHRPIYALWVSIIYILMGTGIFIWAESLGYIVPLTYWPTPTVSSMQDLANANDEVSVPQEIGETLSKTRIMFPNKSIWAGEITTSTPNKSAPPLQKVIARPVLDTLRKEYIATLPQQPDFNPFIYSLELFVPLMPLNQEEYWQVDATGGGALFRWYSWFHIASGWYVTTVLVALISGLIKK